MVRVQSISPRPQVNNFSRDTVPLKYPIPQSCKCKISLTSRLKNWKTHVLFVLFLNLFIAEIIKLANIKNKRDSRE